MDEKLSKLISEALQHELKGPEFNYRDFLKKNCTKDEYLESRIAYADCRRIIFTKMQFRRFELGLISVEELEGDF